jgi:cell division protein YceG involved in septum cleavage
MSSAGSPGRPRRRAVAAFAFALLLGPAGCRGTNLRDERVTVPPGTSFGAVTDTLAAHGVISNRRVFRLIARVRRLDRSVQAGVYQFPPGTSSWQVLDVLAKGAAVSQKFTVPEGLTIPEVAALASERLGIPEDSTVTAASDGAAASALLGVPVRSFEGFLRPETYILPIGVGAGELVRIMQYAIFLATGRRKSRLYERDYQFASPYNTYLHPGLPPGPVNSPSQRSLQASLYPAKVPYLYFVAGPDGHHLFAKTYTEHLRNIAKVRAAH